MRGSNGRASGAVVLGSCTHKSHDGRGISQANAHLASEAKPQRWKPLGSKPVRLRLSNVYPIQICALINSLVAH
jgi:hypothetical protein